MRSRGIDSCKVYCYEYYYSHIVAPPNIGGAETNKLSAKISAR